MNKFIEEQKLKSMRPEPAPPTPEQLQRRHIESLIIAQHNAKRKTDLEADLQDLINHQEVVIATVREGFAPMIRKILNELETM